MRDSETTMSSSTLYLLRRVEQESYNNLKVMLRIKITSLFNFVYQRNVND